MKILVPLGLLALIGIPALIIIYIIKPRYQKRNVTSTFIWKLSLKYRKRKIPLEWLQKSLLLLIQICLIGLIATVLIQPARKVKSSEVEKAIILDVSYSMQAESNKETRLNRAIKQIEKELDYVSEENKLTIILGKENPTYLVRRESSVSRIKYELMNIEATYEECNFDDALKLANAIIDENPSTMVYFYTDCQYKSTGYVNVVDFSNNEWNIGILDVEKEFKNGVYKIITHIGNYNKDANANLVISINFDDETEKVIESQSFTIKSNEEKEIIFEDLDIYGYKDIHIEILDSFNKEIKDSLLSDNIYFEQNFDNIEHKVELVGNKDDKFITSALKSIAPVNLKITGRDEKPDLIDKELYIFDSYIPGVLPDDGTIWFINPIDDIPNLDLSIGGEIPGDFKMSATNNTNSKIKGILDYITPSTIEASKIRVISNYENYDVLLECNGHPILLVGEYNNAKVVVLAMDIHFSDLPITINFIMLLQNLFKYSVTTTTQKSIYNVGEKLTINAKARTEELYFNDEMVMNAISYKDSTEIILDKPGIYEIRQVLTNKSEIVDKIFVKTSKNETNFRYTLDFLAVDEYVNLELGITGTPGSNSFDYSKLTKYFAMALLVLVIIEWGVQYREQY